MIPGIVWQALGILVALLLINQWVKFLKMEIAGQQVVTWILIGFVTFLGAALLGVV